MKRNSSGYIQSLRLFSTVFMKISFFISIHVTRYIINAAIMVVRVLPRTRNTHTHTHTFTALFLRSEFRGAISASPRHLSRTNTGHFSCCS